MENNLEDFLEEDLWNYFNSDNEDAEAEEYNNEYEDALAEEMNDESYYGRDAGEVLEELEENLDGEESDEEDNNDDNNEEENYILNNSNAIGRIGEIFAKKYLEELFKVNAIDLKVKEKDKDNEDYDLEIYGNGEEYLIEVKLSTSKTHPIFKHIHLKNDFDYLLLIWHPSDDGLYFALLSKEEAKDISTPENTNRKEDNKQIQRRNILDEDISNNLARIFNIEKDLSNGRKLKIYKEAENEVFDEYYKNIDMNTLTGKLKMLGSLEKGDIMQDELYKYLHYFDADTINNGDGDFDILYKNKRIEVKFSTMHDDKNFHFYNIKPENFDFLFLMGLEAVDGKDVFYFDIESANEFKEWKNKNTRGGKIYSRNGNDLHMSRSSFNFGNHMTIEEIDNYIESHS